MPADGSAPERAPIEQVLYLDHLLRISCSVTPALTVIRLTGEIDVTNSHETLSTLLRTRHIDDQLIVDLDQVTFADVSAVRALSVFASDGTAQVRNTPAHLARLMNLLKIPPFD